MLLGVDAIAQGTELVGVGGDIGRHKGHGALSVLAVTELRDDVVGAVLVPGLHGSEQSHEVEGRRHPAHQAR